MANERLTVFLACNIYSFLAEYSLHSCTFSIQVSVVADGPLYFFFFFFFLRLDPRSFPPFSSLFLFFSSPLFCAFLPHGYLGRACLVFLKKKILRFFHTLEASTVLPIHAGLLIFISHIVCVPMYSNILNL